MAFEISDSFSESIFSGQQAQDQGPSGGGDIYGLPPRTSEKSFSQGGGMSFGETGPSPYAASDPWASTDIGPAFYPTRPQALPSMVQGADQPESDWSTVLGSVVTQFPTIMKKELGALLEAPARTIGLDSLAEMGRGWSHEADNELQRTTPNMHHEKLGVPGGDLNASEYRCRSCGRCLHGACRRVCCIRQGDWRKAADDGSVHDHVCCR
jgi:hypothetical protein